MVVNGRRVLSLVALMLVATLVISGCAPRVAGGIVADNASADETFIDMPALVIEYDESGEASLFGMPSSVLGAVSGSDLSSLDQSPETIQRMVDGNIQHIAINNQPNGLRFYVNGKTLPGMVWDAESLEALSETLALFGTDAGPISTVLPLLPKLGFGLVMKMPTAAGAAAIPMTPPNVQVLSAAAAQDQFQQAKNTQLLADISLSYDEEGNLEVGGLPPVFAFMPIPWDQMSMPADTVAGLTEQGIESLSITTVDGGILVAINGNTLPYIQWAGEGEFANMVEVLGSILGAEGAGAQVASILPQLQPILNVAGVKLSVSFPGESE